MWLLIRRPCSFHRLSHSHHYPCLLWLFSSLPSNISQGTELISSLQKLSKKKKSLSWGWWWVPIIQHPGGSEDYKFQISLGYKVDVRSTWSAQQDPFSKQTGAAKSLSCPPWLCPCHSCSTLPPWGGEAVLVIQLEPTLPGHWTLRSSRRSGKPSAVFQSHRLCLPPTAPHTASSETPALCWDLGNTLLRAQQDTIKCWTPAKRMT